MGWSKVKLSDILHRKRESIIIVPDEEYKLVTIKLHHNGLILRETKKGAHIKSKMSRVRSGDFLLSGIDARNGAFGIVPNELDDAIITNDFWCLVPNEKIIIKEFLLFLTSTPYFDYICNQSSDGTTQRIRLQKDKFFNYEITIPLLGEQEQILKMLSGKTALCDGINVENFNQLDLLKKIRQQILQDAVQGKLVPQDPNNEPASELLERIKAEKERLIREKKIRKGKPLPEIKPEEIPFEIPENWVWCRLANVCSRIHYGLNTSAIEGKDDVKLLRITDIQNNRVNWNNVPSCEYTKSDFDNHLLKENDIVIARTGGTIGKSFLVKDIPVESMFASYLIRVIPSKLIDADYIKIFLESPNYWEQLNDAAWGAGQPNVNGTSLSKLYIPIPTFEEQNRIVIKIEQLMTLCDELEQSIKQNQKYTQELLQVALKEALESESA